MTVTTTPTTIGILALQGAFSEHLQLLRIAASTLPHTFTFTLVKTPADLSLCTALIIPGGESTAIALLAERSNLLEPLRSFVKVAHRPTWGTCAGMILLSEAANRTKKGGQELIGGLGVRVNRNYFGRQVESFESVVRMGWMEEGEEGFRGVFIRAPIVECVLEREEVKVEGEVYAPGMGEMEGKVEVLAVVRRGEEGERIVAVRQGNVVGTSFHPELTSDARMHRWWLQEVVKDLERRALEKDVV